MALPSSPVPLWRRIEADPTDFFSAEEVARSKAYQRPMQRAKAISALISFLVLFGFTGLKIGPKLIDAIGVTAWPLRLFVVVLAFVVIDAVAGFPVAWWTYRHDKLWAFDTRAPGMVATDALKQSLLSVFLLTLIFLPLWAVIRATDLWWLLGTIVLLVVSLVLALLAPTLQRLFNKFTPLDDEVLRARLLALAEGAGARVKEIFVMDASKRTRKDNAFFGGLGRTKRIVVFDNMLELGHDAVEVVVAHEIGHWRRKHIVRNVATSVLTMPVVLGVAAAIVRWEPAQRFAGVASEGDPAAFPLLLLAFGVPYAALSALVAAESRWKERAADLDALELTGNLEAYRHLWRAMPERNLPDLDPSWWRRIRLTHPPVAERLAFADVWERARNR